LGFTFARRKFARNDKPNDWAAFDSGAAWMALNLQARMLGLYAHGMAGFDREKSYDILGVPESEYEVLCAFALGRYGDREALPDNMKKDEQPNSRKPLTEIVFRGKFQ
jgi:nitroreductase